jgi:murein tripeptide amidase MpaA
VPISGLPPARTAIPVPRFDQFYRHAELTRLLQDYAAALPGLVQPASIGKSHEGRDIWLLTVTNSVTGPDTTSPRSGSTATSTPPSSPPAPPACTSCTSWPPAPTTPQARHLLDTRVVYICPRLNPDGAELALADRPRHIRSRRRGPTPTTKNPSTA